MSDLAYRPGQRVEVWLAGWDQWLGGTVEAVGYLSVFACARVWLDGHAEPGVFRSVQMRVMEGLFAL